MIGRGRDRQPDRFLATILFTDIVGSTDLAVQLGDREWRRVLAAHNAVIRRVLRQFGGREIDTAGDGFLCAFDQPAQAVRAADTILAQTTALGMSLRAGIHTGECERIGNKISGVAVHIAARVMAAAQPGEVLVSSTVRDLVPGSGLEFTDRGGHQLKGVPIEWHLFGVIRAQPDGALLTPTATAANDDSVASRRSGRTLLLVSGTVTATLLAVGAAWAAGLIGEPNQAVPVPEPDTVVEIEVATGKVVAVRGVPQGPVALAFDGTTQHLWVASLDAGIVSDIAIGAPGQPQTTGRVGRPTGLAIGGGYVWVADALDKTITLLDAASREPQATIEDVVARSIVFGFDSAWASDDLNDWILRIDPRSGQVVNASSLDPGAYPFGLAVGEDAIWAGNRGLSTLTRIDPGSGAVSVSAIALRTPPAALSAVPGTLWIAGTDSDTVLRLDTQANSVAKTIDVCDQPTTLAAAGDGVWVGCAGTQEAWHLGHEGDRLATVALNGVPTDIIVVGERVYVTVRSP